MKRTQRTINIMKKVQQIDDQQETSKPVPTKNINNTLKSLLHVDSNSSKNGSDGRSKLKIYKKVENKENTPSPSRLLITQEPQIDDTSPKTLDVAGIDQNMVNNLSSVSPPPYSPLTPLLLRDQLNKIGEFEELSPLPIMSPETQKLFDTLCEPSINKELLDNLEYTAEDEHCNQKTIHTLSNIDEDFIEDSDDSVRDPDYVLDRNKEVRYINESDSQESDISSNGSKSKSVKIYTQIASRIVRQTAYSPLVNIAMQTQACSSQNQFDRFPIRPLRRRVSEISFTKQPSKTLLRRSSAPGAMSFVQKCAFNDNLKTTLPKKRHVSDPSKWKRHVERNKRLKGAAYKTIKGKSVAARPMKQSNCVKLPKHKCHIEVPEEIRKNIYQTFRSLETLEAQRQFIIQHVTRTLKKRQTKSGPSRKKYTNNYSLTVDLNKKVKVCREFFLQTLNITEGLVRGALNKVSSAGTLLRDERGRKAPSNKLNSVDEDFLKGHILSFPAMESHYCRKNSQYKYLDSTLNVKKMYLLYRDKCQQEDKISVGCEKYRKVFRSYKLKFHVPKKDLCKKCVAYSELSRMNDEPTNTQKEIHEKHLKRRDDAYLRRDFDKQAAKCDTNILAFNFDLQAVLQTPKGAAGPYFYVRKLAVYNLTLYNLGNQNVDCYTWDETEGKRGSVEIATSVYKYIINQSDITHVRMMSDNCSGQQKNFNFSCMLLFLVVNHPTIKIIDHVFFESGHSHMECDSIHSKIEQKSKNTPVYTPDGWVQIMRMARTNPRPFNVVTLLHDDFLDFNSSALQFTAETKRTQKSQQTLPEVPKFQDAVWVQYRHENPKSIFIKTDYNSEGFTELKLKAKKGKSNFIKPKPAYSGRLPISKAKKTDLVKLCQDLLIPRSYHQYYQNLPVSETVTDRLPEPDNEEDDEQD